MPLLGAAWLALTPLADATWLLPGEHFLAVTVVSLLAAGVALLVARVALRMAQLQVLLTSLGFLAMAGFFAVHALSTPGALGAMPSYGNPYATAGNTPAAGDYGGTVIGLSAFLSLFVPSWLFAAGSVPSVVEAVRRRVPGRRGILAAGLGALVLAYAALSLWRADLVGAIPLSGPPGSYILAAVSVALLIVASVQYGRQLQRTRLPVHLALMAAFVLLAQAQVLMVATRFWSPAWWGYHLVMLAAVIVALIALFVELDRRRGLERFLPPEVVERVVAGDSLRAAGERRIATILFADLRGSTALAETLPAEDVVSLLNSYVGAMAEEVFNHDGMLDKYLGDGLMAVFGIVEGGADGADQAVQAALAMRGRVRAINARTGRSIGFGVGIHTGDVVLGAVGIPRRLDFTAIGDTVNTAARMEALCKDLGVSLVISETTVAGLKRGRPALRDVGPMPIRGRQGSVRVFTISDGGPDEGTPRDFAPPFGSVVLP